jgi:EAL domain-containing protein (putative c-di-GMP-specific phosphodiesterase class I)/CHASE2 domain-containing sensor protein
MGHVPRRRKDKVQKSPLKLLIWTAIAGLIIGALGIGQLLEDQLRIARNGAHSHNASGDIVFVGIDDKALSEVGRWPWSRETHAQLVDVLTAAGAKRIFFDVMFEAPTDQKSDQLLADAIRRSGRVTLAARGSLGAKGNNGELIGPLPLLGAHASLASIRWDYNYQNAVWELPFEGRFQGKPVPSLAAALAGKPARRSGDFPVDYSIDLKSVPKISAADVIEGRSLPQIHGKDVVIGADSAVMGDRFFVPGVGRMPGAYIHIAGAETLRKGTPIRSGWFGPFLLTMILCCVVALRAPWKVQSATLATLTVLLLATPILLEANLIFVDVAPALITTFSIWGGLLWRRYKYDGVTNAVSGLPNLTALRAYKNGRDQALIAGRILNYAEIVASLPAEAERVLVEQIVGRLTIGSPEKTTYHGDGGIFAWFEEAKLPFGHHIDALHSLFRNPVRVNGQAIDLSVSFGVEIGSGRSLPNRLASALVAAEEAAHDGLKWKMHDPEKLNDASWKLSLLSRLDQAIDQGEVWVAYQPKLDLKSREIIGAEALARWTHPEKGPIAATEFIAAAEQHGRIGKLTDFVLEQAIKAAASINAKGREFHVAVNLSARLLGDTALPHRIAELLLQYRMEPQFLTLELTETSAMGTGEALHLLAALRELGVEISIDDYGTGLSTLDYLKKVPASELKIDQSFVRGMIENRSDRVMVQSTIAMAHSLGRTVVAEGVEQRDVLEALIEMKCDVAQGFIIGRPMSIESLVRRLATERKRSVA